MRPDAGVAYRLGEEALFCLMAHVVPGVALAKELHDP